MRTGQYDHISDLELLENYYRDQDQQWIGLLLERYTLLLLGVCMKYLKDENEAREAVQQIFLKVLTEVAKYRIEYFKSWLYMVAKNHCLMKLRRQPGKAYSEVHENITADEETEKADWLEKETTYELLEESLSELNDEQRQCVILFYLKKNTYQEVSEKTGYTLMQVKSYLQNGKRNLKILLEKKIREKRVKRNEG